ncbi:hypothetical protein PI125_g13376 [Phytophthora idaei]|nr:hypothetical protein PI125_g13376 [Phytophthora idaei]
MVKLMYTYIFRIQCQHASHSQSENQPEQQVEAQESPVMAPVPRYVKSVALKNSTSHHVTVVATFGSDEFEAEGKAKIKETCELAPGAETTIKEREYDMGGWTATAALFSLEVEHSTDSKLLGKTLYTPSVSGIVDVLHVDIGADEEAKNFKVAAVREA